MEQGIFNNSDYIVLDELGNGGEASVVKIRHKELDYIRAVRILNKPVLGGKKTKVYQDFINECKVLLKLGNGCNSNIVRIYKPELVSGHAIVEMDFVDGYDVYRYLEQNSFFVPAEEVLKLLHDIGGALAYCHVDIYKYCIDRDVDDVPDDPEDGSKMLVDVDTEKRLIKKYRVIHNDIHSGNIMRRENGDYVLLDFGLSLDGDGQQRSSKKQGGVPEFKAPEKWENESVLTTQSDIYSFGILLYEYLCGKVPFKYNSENPNSMNALYELGLAHQKEVPQSIFETRKKSFDNLNLDREYIKDYPDWLDALIMKCLSKKPEDRFKNAREMMDFVKENELADDKNSRNEESVFIDHANSLLIAKLDALTDKCNTLNEEHITLTDKYNSLNEELVTLKDKYNTLNEEHVTLTDKHNTLNEEHVTLTDKHNTLNEEHVTLTDKYNSLNEEYGSLTDRYKNQKNEYASLMTICNEIMAENNELIERNKLLEMANNNIREKLESLLQNNDFEIYEC